jgi:hypothetical protein
VKCSTCSAEIADKAIVCYRCGTPTAIPEPIRRAAPPPSPSRARLYVLLGILLVLAAILVFTLLRRNTDLSRAADPSPRSVAEQPAVILDVRNL